MALNLCGLIGDNTGPVPCDVTRGVPKFPFVGGKVFQPSDYATQTAFQTALKTSVKLANGNTSKLFPFPEIQGNAEKTDANKEGTLGYGFKQVLLEGRPAYEFDVLVGQTQFQKLRKFNRVIAPVLIADDANNMWGVAKSDGTFVGNDAYIFVTGNPFGDGSKNIVAKITFSFVSVSDFNDSSAYMPLNFNPNEVKGLLDVVLSELSAHSTNVYHIAANVLTAKLGTKINVASTFGADLADETLWTLVKDSDGTSVTITSVAVNSAGTGFDFTIDSTAYGALASGAKLRVGLAVPATLDAAGVTGVEAPDYLIITK